MNKRFTIRLGAAGAALIASGAAMAQGADPFATAVADLTTKVTTWGGALAGLAAVGVGFMVAVKYIKKIRGAA